MSRLEDLPQPLSLSLATFVSLLLSAPQPLCSSRPLLLRALCSSSPAPDRDRCGLGFALSKAPETVGRYSRELLPVPFGPAHPYAADHCGRAEPEVEAKVALRQVTAAALDFADKCRAGRLDLGASAYGASVPAVPCQGDLDPVVR